MYLLGIDVGSSRVKASIVDGKNGLNIETTYLPKKEMKIFSQEVGWAEQNPEEWWKNILKACREAIIESDIDPLEIEAIGVSYQMHGLVMIDRDLNPIGRSIIWCDSRASKIGEQAFDDLSSEFCRSHLLNSPGNFTASKLKWVKEFDEPSFNKIYKIMLPGDYIVMKLTGEISTTVSGLSEMVLWDFEQNKISDELLNYYGIRHDVIPDIVPNFNDHANLLPEVAYELGLRSGIPISYRAGDQMNAAFSLALTQPGDFSAKGSNSGVIYGITDHPVSDPYSRINTFAHINFKANQALYGSLMCINGVGRLNSWLKETVMPDLIFSDELNRIEEETPPGANGMFVLPFGNGSERILANKNIGAQLINLSFNTHNKDHIIRASHEGIAFAMNYGLELMQGMGLHPKVINAGKSGIFMSPVFLKAFASVSGVRLRLYNTEGSEGAARGAGFGAGIFSTYEECFTGLKATDEVSCDPQLRPEYQKYYLKWKEYLDYFYDINI